MNLIRFGLELLSPGGAGGKLSILIFHRVLPQPDPLYPDEMHAARFDELCGWLSAWFNVLPLDHAVDALQRGRLPPRALAITFDDGYADNAEVALPLLQRHRLPATFFVATGFLDGGIMWNDVIVESIRRCPHERVELPAVDGMSLGEWALSDFVQRRAAIRHAIDRVKYLPMSQRLEFVQALAQACSSAVPCDLMMSSAQVRRLVDCGMTVGGHTVSHPILARIDDATARREIADGRERLRALTGTAVDLFAYPNGKPGADYGPLAVDTVRSLGFRAAVSTSWGWADAGTDHFQLPRFTPWDQKKWAFGLRMAANLRRRPEMMERAAA